MTYTNHYTYSDRDGDQLLISTSSRVPAPLIYIRHEQTYHGVYAPTGAEAVRMARALLDATGNRYVRLVDPAAPDLDAADLVEPGDEVPTLAELADQLTTVRRRLEALERFTLYRRTTEEAQ